MNLHHFGFLCVDLEKSILTFQDLGLTQTFRIGDKLRQVELVFMEDNFGHIIELVAPLSNKAIITDLIKKNNNSFYHTCYVSQNLEEDICKMEKKGFVLLEPPKESVAFNYNRVTFLFNKYLGIIELVEKKNESRIFK